MPQLPSRFGAADYIEAQLQWIDHRIVDTYGGCMFSFLVVAMETPSSRMSSYGDRQA